MQNNKIVDIPNIILYSELMPKIVEDTVREFLAEKYGLQESVIEGKDFDADGYLLKFKKPEIALEVKWKRVGKEDISKAEETLSNVDAPRKILFVLDKTGLVSTQLQIIDSADLLTL